MCMTQSRWFWNVVWAMRMEKALNSRWLSQIASLQVEFSLCRISHAAKIANCSPPPSRPRPRILAVIQFPSIPIPLALSRTARTVRIESRPNQRSSVPTQATTGSSSIDRDKVCSAYSLSLLRPPTFPPYTIQLNQYPRLGSTVPCAHQSPLIILRPTLWPPENHVLTAKS